MSAPLEIAEIKALLPHRYPFLMLDRVLSYESGQSAHAIKNISINEPYFQGHFPDYPVMPGVYIIEAMAQLGGVLLMQRIGNTQQLALLAGVDGCRFRRQVVPGDQLHIYAEILRFKKNIGKIKARAEVEGETITQGELLFGLIDGP